MTLVILAAGLGSRYGGLKQLDPMTDAGNFIIDFSVYDAIRAGFDQAVFIIKRENLEQFRETIGNRIAKKIKVKYVFQDANDLPSGLKLPAGRTKPWGTGHAVWCARDLVTDNFAVINADDFYGAETFRHLAEHLSKPNLSGIPAHHCMVGFRAGNTLTENGTVSRGVCEVGEDGRLIRVTERTKVEKRGRGAAYLDDDGTTWTKLDKATGEKGDDGAGILVDMDENYVYFTLPDGRTVTWKPSCAASTKRLCRPIRSNANSICRLRCRRRWRRDSATLRSTRPSRSGRA